MFGNNLFLFCNVIYNLSNDCIERIISIHFQFSERLKVFFAEPY